MVLKLIDIRRIEFSRSLVHLAYLVVSYYLENHFAFFS